MERQIRAAQVDGNRLVPFRRFQIVDRRPDPVDARIGDDNVETAECPNEVLDRSTHRRLVRHVRREGEPGATKLENLLHDSLDLLNGVAQNADARAVTGEGQRRGLADPGARTGNEDDLSCKQHRQLHP